MGRSPGSGRTTEPPAPEPRCEQDSSCRGHQQEEVALHTLVLFQEGGAWAECGRGSVQGALAASGWTARQGCAGLALSRPSLLSCGTARRHQPPGRDVPRMARGEIRSGV